MSHLTAIGVTQLGESRDDMMLSVIDEANLAYDDAESEARNAVTRADVIERIAETYGPNDDKWFIRALRDSNKQAMQSMISKLSDVFEDIVREKRDALLATKDNH